MLMLKSTHDAIVAEMQLEIAGLKGSRDAANIIAALRSQDATKSALLAGDRAKQIRILEDRLAVFTAPRARNAKGHFLPIKGAEAC